MDEDHRLRQLKEAFDSHPADAFHHFNLGVSLWERGGESTEKSVEHFLVSSKLNPNDGATFRFLGHYYSQVSVDSQRATKCYRRAVILNPDDSEAGCSFRGCTMDDAYESCLRAVQTLPLADFQVGPGKLSYLVILHLLRYLEL